MALVEPYRCIVTTEASEPTRLFSKTAKHQSARDNRTHPWPQTRTRHCPSTQITSFQVQTKFTQKMTPSSASIIATVTIIDAQN